MLRLIPYKSFSIDTSLSMEEAARLVSEAITQPRSWLQRWRKADKEFEGSVSSSGFTISRAIRYRNSFLPYLYGRFVQTPDGVRVVVRMTLNPVVMLFAIAWCTFVGGFFLLALAGMLSAGQLDATLLLPFAMLLFFYGMVVFGYGVEAGKAEQFLHGLFEFHRRFYDGLRK